MAVARYYDHDLGEWVLLAAGRDGTPGASSWDDLTGKPSAYPPESHTHTPESIGAAPADHTHTQYATLAQVAARTPEVRVVSSADQATAPGVLYIVTGA